MTEEEMAIVVQGLATYQNDPYGFALWAFPWGEPGTELERRELEPWQIDLLQKVRDGLLTLDEAVQIATTSGHGVGKSCLVAIIIIWAISTMTDTRGVVTANTENQLKTKTWVEVAKWHRLSICRELFEYTATALFSRDPEHRKTWRIDMVPWSEANTEAFAGLHNQGKRILVIFDEASAIHDSIHEVTEGALTDENTQILWLMFGNPTKTTGRFREAFPGGQFASRWIHYCVDSRTVSFTNKKQINKWIEDYGDDSDFVRVRVKGEFPRIDSASFISRTLALEATEREMYWKQDEPIVIGVDVGRFGDDPSVILPRQGLDAKGFEIEIHPYIDTMSLAGRVANMYRKLGATMVFVDSGGVGGGVVDRLVQLNIPVTDVDFSRKAKGYLGPPGVAYANHRAEIWGSMRDWLKRGALPEIEGYDIVKELTAPTYRFNAREAIQLESKMDMRRRGEESPNIADALAVTFSEPIYAKAELEHEYEGASHVEDYNPLALERTYQL